MRKRHALTGLLCSAALTATSLVAAAPATSASTLKMAFSNAGMVSMPAQYAKNWGGMPVTHFVYISNDVHGGTIELRTRKAGTSTWRAFGKVPVPRSCTQNCDVYDGRQQVAPVGGKFPFAAQGAGSWTYQMRYVKGTTGTAATTAWLTAGMPGAPQKSVVVEVPTSKVTVGAPVRGIRGRSVTFSSTAKVKDPAAYVTYSCFNDGCKGTVNASRSGATATFQLVDRRGKVFTLGSRRVSVYRDAAHAFTVSASLKVPVKATKGVGKVRVVFDGRLASDKRASAYRSFTVR